MSSHPVFILGGKWGDPDPPTQDYWGGSNPPPNKSEPKFVNYTNVPLMLILG